MSMIIRVGTFCLNILFSIMKICPVQNKITYISRQMNTIPLDFRLVIDNFQKKNPTYKHIVLAKRIPEPFIGKIGYGLHILKQMYHIATSKVVILDTYCIPVSILKQRNELTVIQMWHALGAFKKFGYSILDQEEGSSSQVAHLMKMHHNYTYVLSSSEYAAPFFAEAFHVPYAKMKIFPLPKTDMLLNQTLQHKTIQKIYQHYPQLKSTNKKIIVYAPTFRKNEDELYKAIQEFIKHINFNKYEFVLKKHPLTKFVINDARIIEDNLMTSLEFFHVADYIITDYSAVLFEASLLDKPIYFYAFDYQTYMQKRALYIDYQTQLPGPVCYQIDELIDIIESHQYDEKKMNDFKELMIAPYQQSYTDDFVNFVLSEINT
ncbi:MAG: CDP-glycerol glycerophosphotransferase family protein [Coprobacillus cateniformis]|uniref:CDP-glycerol glycerophosphotransferase family protein n=1 Tax=Coprobacillus cateniformis TaxID=100884 RepID=UPI0039A05138